MSGVALSTLAGGRYRIEKTLGRGGMATVFLAEDAELGRRVAVKVLDGRFGADDEITRRFRREAKTIARLQHPNVVSVYDAGEEDGRLFIVMECVPGEGLDALLERETRLDPERVSDLGVQAAAALGHAHALGVVHRDVKPANLLLSDDGVLKVTDFGIARGTADAATQLTQAGTILGTAAYLAPEQARGEPVGPPADVFALGVVLYEALTGRVPWPVEGLAQLAELGARPPAPMIGVPADLERAVMRALSADPAARPPDGEAFRRDLAGEVTGATRATTVLPGPERPTVVADAGPRPYRSRIRRGPLVLGALILAGLVAALVLVLASGNGDAPARGEGPAPAQVEPVPSSDDAAEQARSLEQWIRAHTAGGRAPR